MADKDIVKPIVASVLDDKAFQAGVTSMVEELLFDSRKIQEAIEEGVRSARSNASTVTVDRGEVDRLEGLLQAQNARLERLEEALRTIGQVARDLR